MVDAPWTAVYDTPNKSLRQNVPRRGVVLHHAAMTSLSGLHALAMGRKQVSATALVKDNQCELIVPDDRYRPWSLSSAYWDSALRSVETANDSTHGWTISDASHWTLARCVAYWAERDGFRPHRDGHPSTWTVIGHREVHSIHGASYATACPGGLDLDLVTRRAQSILGGSTAGGGTTPIEEDDMTPDQANKLEAIYQAIFYGASWTDKDKAVHKAEYGLFQTVRHNQTLLSRIISMIAEIGNKITGK